MSKKNIDLEDKFINKRKKIRKTDLIYFISQLINALPTNRDWLSPDLEQAMRDAISTEKQEKKLSRKTKVKEFDITVTAGEFLDQMENMVDQHGRATPLCISIPYRNGIGLHYEKVKNITVHEGMIDIHTTIPEYDDVKKRYP